MVKSTWLFLFFQDRKRLFLFVYKRQLFFLESIFPVAFLFRFSESCLKLTQNISPKCDPFFRWQARCVLDFRAFPQKRRKIQQSRVNFVLCMPKVSYILMTIKARNLDFSSEASISINCLVQLFNLVSKCFLYNISIVQFLQTSLQLRLFHLDLERH